VTLELIRDKENIRSINLRGIARTLGCAHTNLYNHFSDLDGIFWDALDEILDRSMVHLKNKLEKDKHPKDRLDNFYNSLIEFYIENRGWFTLFWMEKLHGTKSEKTMSKIRSTMVEYNSILKNIIQDHYKINPSDQQVISLFHTVHCYLHGEISMFLCGRGLIDDKPAFTKQLLGECRKLSNLLVKSF
ncbi:MAG TPA: TetR/AcrR family transcriptional regulator, partial [Chitinispirillaceae bacterium]|nr:TetR/AcrR family transcriptional regulator [Chitinispirillaceae bacterium]